MQTFLSTTAAQQQVLQENQIEIYTTRTCNLFATVSAYKHMTWESHLWSASPLLTHSPLGSVSHPGQRAAGGCFQPALIPPCGLKMMLSSGACHFVDAQISAAGWQSERMLVGNPRKLVSDLSQSRCWCRDTLHHMQAWHRVFPAAWHRLESIALSRNLQSVLYCLRGLKSTVKFQYSYKKTVFYFSTGSLFQEETVQFGDWFLESGWCIHAGVYRPQIPWCFPEHSASLSHPTAHGLWKHKQGLAFYQCEWIFFSH